MFKRRVQWEDCEDLIDKGDIDNLRVLLDDLSRKAINKIADDNLGNLLHCAVKKGHMPIVSYLMDKGVDVDKLNIYLQTPLHICMFMGHKDVGELLIKRGGAKINEQCDLRATPLDGARYGGHIQCCVMLYCYGAKDTHLLPDNGDRQSLSFSRNLTSKELMIQKWGQSWYDEVQEVAALFKEYDQVVEFLSYYITRNETEIKSPVISWGDAVNEDSVSADNDVKDVLVSPKISSPSVPVNKVQFSGIMS